VVRIEEAVSSTRLRSRPPPCFRMGMGLGGDLLLFFPPVSFFQIRFLFFIFSFAPTLQMS
jgi:hypothetical protein